MQSFPIFFTLLFSVTVPSADQQNDTIQISGPATKVEAAQQALLNRVVELEREREDRVLRSFAVQVRTICINCCIQLKCEFFWLSLGGSSPGVSLKNHWEKRSCHFQAKRRLSSEYHNA